jgi:hypothetical protein
MAEIPLIPTNAPPGVPQSAEQLISNSTTLRGITNAHEMLTDSVAVAPRKGVSIQ